MFELLAKLTRHVPVQLAGVDGVRLRNCGQGAWVADRELRLGGGVVLPIRMVLLETEVGRLICYSPVALDSATVEAIAGLGQVDVIVVPNRSHTLFLAAARRQFPAAKVIVPPTHGDISGSQPAAIVSSLGTATEMFVLQTRPGFEELVLYHDKSETLVVADLFFNLPRASGLLGLLLKLNGLWNRPGQGHLQKMLIARQRTQMRVFYRWALTKPFTQLCMSHGRIVDDEARETFYQLFHRYV